MFSGFFLRTAHQYVVKYSFYSLCFEAFVKPVECEGRVSRIVDNRCVDLDRRTVARRRRDRCLPRDLSVSRHRLLASFFGLLCAPARAVALCCPLVNKGLALLGICITQLVPAADKPAGNRMCNAGRYSYPLRSNLTGGNYSAEPEEHNFQRSNSRIQIP